MHPSYAVINLTNIKTNFLNIRKKINDTKIMAVVKADAYGHGMCECTKALESLGKQKPDYYAVAFPDEGKALRKNKIKQPILVFEPILEEQVQLLFDNNLIATVFDLNHLKILERGLKKYIINSKKEHKISVHVKVDTGMNRLGVPFNEAYDFISLINKNKIFRIDGIYTHFATADEKIKKFAYLQIKRFEELLNKLKNNKIKYGFAHAANSGAILNLPESYFDMVRPGIAIYGYYPSLETKQSVKLNPAMSLISRVASVKIINK